MHRRTDLWGPDGMIITIFLNTSGSPIRLFNFVALVFDPDRFLDQRVQKYLTPNPFIFCPFNAGPRICLGQQVITTHKSCTHTLFIKNSLFHSSPIMKLPISLFAYYRSSLDLLWISLTTFNLRQNLPPVKV